MTTLVKQGIRHPRLLSLCHMSCMTLHMVRAITYVHTWTSICHHCLTINTCGCTYRSICVQYTIHSVRSVNTCQDGHRVGMATTHARPSPRPSRVDPLQPCNWGSTTHRKASHAVQHTGSGTMYRGGSHRSRMQPCRQRRPV
jgi:hypothetical protein